MTERINKKKELESLNQQLEIALNAGQLGSYHLDLKSRELTGSPIFRSIYGIPNEKKLDFQNIIDTILPEYHSGLFDQVNHSIESEQPYHSEYQIKKNDQTYWIHSSGLPSYDTDGNAVGMTGIVLDITERKNYETQKDDFLGIASHELKTPLTSLKATIQLLTRLKNKPDHSSIPTLIDQSARSMEKLNSLVDDLLNMHRISEGQLKLKKQEFTISKLLENCCEDVRLAGKYELITEGDLSATAFADEHRIEQVIVNFVNNAVKYAPESKKIILLIENNAEEIKISVRDFGEGIDPSVQPYLFDRYFRVNHEGRKYSGLGLGLYISTEIIKGHGGNIGVNSIVGQGSSFWFTLPK